MATTPWQVEAKNRLETENQVEMQSQVESQGQVEPQSVSIQDADSLSRYVELILDTSQDLRNELRYSEALSLLTLPSSIGIDPLASATLLHQRGVILLEMGYYKIAAEEMQSSISLLNTLDEPESTANVYNSLGTLYHAIEDYDRAIRFYNRAEEILQREDVSRFTSPDELRFKILINSAITLTRQEKFEEATNGYSLALSVAEQMGDSLNLAAALYNQGNLLLQAQSPERAKPYFLRSMEISSLIDNSYGRLINLTGLGVTELQLQSFEPSLRLLMDALRIAEENDLKAEKKHIFDLLSTLYGDMQKNELQEEFAEQTKLLADSLLTKEDQMEILTLASNLELELEQREIAEKERELKLLQSRTTWFNTLFVFLLLMSISLIVHFRRRDNKYSQLYKILLDSVQDTDVGKTSPKSGTALAESDPESVSVGENPTDDPLPKEEAPIASFKKDVHNESIQDVQETDTQDLADDDLDIFEKNKKLEVLYDAIVQKLLDESMYKNAELTLQDLSAAVGSNNRYVSEAINIVGNLSFYDLVNGYRVQHACDLLIRHGRETMSTYEIMEESGFRNAATFYRVFKKECGMTPSQLRRQHLKKSGLVIEPTANE